MPAEAAPFHVLAPGLETAGTRVTLSPEESHYLLRVCRARPGDRVSATDGRGALATLRVLDARASLSAEVESLDRCDRRRSARMLCGAPEGERADWMVEKLAELAIGALQPVQCERGEWTRASRRLERWRRLARAALRQSRGRFELQILAPLGLEEALEPPPPRGTAWLADSAGASAAGIAAPRSGAGVCAVGPAAGFAPGEKELFARLGYQPIALASTRLRTETAAVAWAAWWAAPGEEK